MTPALYVRSVAQTAKLIYHPDETVRLLAAAACQSLPDMTPTLILADRLDELDDITRAAKCRRAADLIFAGRPGPSHRRSNLPNYITALFGGLTQDASQLAGWACLWWVPPSPSGLTRTGFLAAIGLQSDKAYQDVMDNLIISRNRGLQAWNLIAEGNGRILEHGSGRWPAECAAQAAHLLRVGNLTQCRCECAGIAEAVLRMPGAARPVKKFGRKVMG